MQEKFPSSMHSVRLEPTKLILIGTRTTYQATGDSQSGKNAGNNKILTALTTTQTTSQNNHGEKNSNSNLNSDSSSSNNKRYTHTIQQPGHPCVGYEFRTLKSSLFIVRPLSPSSLPPFEASPFEASPIL